MDHLVQHRPDTPHSRCTLHVAGAIPSKVSTVFLDTAKCEIGSAIFLQVGRESVSSLHLQGHPVRNRKAAIQGSGSTLPHAAPGIEVGNAQEVRFAKLRTLIALQAVTGPLPLFIVGAAKVRMQPVKLIN